MKSDSAKRDFDKDLLLLRVQVLEVQSMLTVCAAALGLVNRGPQSHIESLVDKTSLLHGAEKLVVGGAKDLQELLDSLCGASLSDYA